MDVIAEKFIALRFRVEELERHRRTQEEIAGALIQRVGKLERGAEQDSPDLLCVHCGKTKGYHTVINPGEYACWECQGPIKTFKAKEEHDADSRTQEQPAQEDRQEETQEGKGQEIANLGCPNCDRPWSEHTGDPRTDAVWVCPVRQASFRMDLLVTHCTRCNGKLTDPGHDWEYAFLVSEDRETQFTATVWCNKERRK